VTERRDTFVSRLFRDAQNVWTLLGVMLTTISGVLIVVFTIAHAMGGVHNPYAGIVGFLILPGVFVFGLILMPVGIVLHRRRLTRAAAKGEAPPRAYPTLDFNDPSLRRVATVIIMLTLINAVVFGSATYLGIEHMETVTFCGATCHTVMQPEFTAYQESPHSRVACVECHIGPGASWFVKSKLDGVTQLFHTALDTYPRPIDTPIKNLRPAQDTCEQCHWPGKHFGDRTRLIAHFAKDEANTPSFSLMVVRTGGGTRETGRHGGIHWWHIESDNRIRYVASDEKRQEIAWVELQTPDGEVYTYGRDGEEPPDAATIDAEARVMDCIDCHNRPTHNYPPPERAMDDVLRSRKDLRKLPFFMKQAVQAIRGDYPTREAGMAAVKETLIDYYKKEQPATWSTAQAEVEAGADAAAHVYGRIVFPEMKTNWETHPNNIGHEDSPGCWRCHDGEMATADGERMIPFDCETCHRMLVEDSPVEPSIDDLEVVRQASATVG
jgi:hypothetical protein